MYVAEILLMADQQQKDYTANILIELCKTPGKFSHCHRVHTGSGAHPTSHSVGIRGSYPGGKAAGA
jgi:hypothetical protein